MAHEDFEDGEETVEVDDFLNAVIVAALDEAKKKMLDGQDLVPFTALARDGRLLIETHPAEDIEDCFDEAERTVAEAVDAEAYAFCYDGYVETDEGDRDIIIAEGGLPGEPEAHALGYFYTMPEGEDGPVEVESEPVYVGPAPNFMR